MIEYANELIEEIKNNKPSNATTITVNGYEIDSVRYTGEGLEIICGDLDIVEEEEYKDTISEYEDALSEISDIVRRTGVI